MTTAQIRLQLKRAGKSLGVNRLYTLFKTLGIRPSGERQRPQHYPEESVIQLKIYFGLVGNGELSSTSRTTTASLKQRAVSRPARPNRSRSSLSLASRAICWANADGSPGG